MITLEFKDKSGIYKIASTIDERCYIGSASNLYTRFHCHLLRLKRNDHHSLKLQRFVNKYGLDSIRFEVIELCDKSALIEREQFWMDTLSPAFNTVPFAANSMGYKHTPESRVKMSAIRKGKQTTGMLGKKHSAETRSKIAEKRRAYGLHPNLIAASIKANTGRKQTPAEIEKRSLAQSKVGRQEAREIWCASQLGVYQSDIARAYGISQRLVCRVLHGIGIYGQYRELDADYFQAQEERFARHTAQERLFVPETKVEQLSLAV